LQCIAVCCSLLQCVAVCCSVLQCVAVCCSVSHIMCNTWSHSAWHIIMQHIMLQCVAVCDSVFQYVAVCCSPRILLQCSLAKETYCTWKEVHKRDLSVSKKANTYQKRPTYREGDSHSWRETCVFQKRPTHMKRVSHIWKETHKRDLNE